LRVNLISQKMKVNNVGLCLSVWFMVIALAANAQTLSAIQHDSLTQVNIKAKPSKLPNIQQISLRAPDKFKIDGKATEWNNQFQAYNRATNIYYTLANDDKYLYLAVQATDPGIINKILGGGATFSINKAGKKDLKDAMCITYPMLKDSGKMVKLSVNFGAMPKIIPGSHISEMQADSFMNINNTLIAKKLKMIMVTGIKGIDTLISMYNADGIKAAGAFDNKMAYTYELAIGLKQLGLSTTDDVKFAYNIKLPGMYDPIAAGGDMSVVTKSGQTVTFTFIKSTPGRTASNPTGQNIWASTDFWGEYTLAKK